MRRIMALLLGLLFFHCADKPVPTIVISPQNDPIEQLAAKELQRYLYIMSGDLVAIETTTELPAQSPAIVLVTRDSPLDARITEQFDQMDEPQLQPQEFRISTISMAPLEMMIVRGGDAMGTLYGVYRLLEEYGVRFYVHGDVVPEERSKFTLLDLEILASPRFALRGIQPFHDFPEGPDWWNVDEYKSIFEQLVKMRMNFIGFHTYPSKPFEGWSKPEPMVWHGTEDQINADGTVKSAYPALHFHTADSTWAYDPAKTSEYLFGANQIFETDNYGANYMKDISAWPHSDEENIRIFNDFGDLQKDAFTFADRLGINVCIGTETPLNIPEPVKTSLRRDGIDPNSDNAKRMVYEGTFRRIKALHPLSYYWFWTPEYWTWQDVPDADVNQTENDIKLALQAARNVDAPFTLATCGWVLGPPKDRAQFDRILPKDMPFSCINREVGFTPVDSNFARIQDRPTWAISWLEDDPALISPQLWVGRVRRDAVDAYNYGCNGLMGIFWRTRILSPMFSALAQAGWDFGDWQDADAASDRDLPTTDFYMDWARTNFGNNVADHIAAIFSRLDGGPLYERDQGERTANLFRASVWAGKGPGGIKIIEAPWDSVRQHFEFVDELAALQPRVAGKANQQRFQYWLDTFRFARASASVGCRLFTLDSLVSVLKTIKYPSEQQDMVRENILPYKAETEEAWGEMVTLLLSTVSTSGAMGTIANLEQHNLRNLACLSKHDSLLAAVLGEPLPEPEFWTEYRGPDRLIVPSERSILQAGEPFRLKVLVLSAKQVKEIKLFWKPFGASSFQSKTFEHEARNVYRIRLAADEFDEHFEYYVNAQLEHRSLVHPVTAEDANTSVIVW